MALYFRGDIGSMMSARDEVLLKEAGYRDISKEGDRSAIESLDGAVRLEFDPTLVKVTVQDSSLRRQDTHMQQRYTEKARPYLEKLKQLLKPDRITDLFFDDLTTSLGIQ